MFTPILCVHTPNASGLFDAEAISIVTSAYFDQDFIHDVRNSGISHFIDLGEGMSFCLRYYTESLFMDNRNLTLHKG